MELEALLASAATSFPYWGGISEGGAFEYAGSKLSASEVDPLTMQDRQRLPYSPDSEGPLTL